MTPGTNLDTQALDETKNNYIMCIVYIADRYGRFCCGYFDGRLFCNGAGGKCESLLDEIYRFITV